MKRVVLAFLGTLVGGFVLFVVANHFHPVANPRRFGEVIGDLAVLFAIAAALDEMRRRTMNRRRSRAGAGGPLPDRSLDAPRARVTGQEHVGAALPVSRIDEVCGPGPLADVDEHPMVFRPYRTPMLVAALLLAGIGVVYVLVVGIRESVWSFVAVQIPGPLVVGASFAGAAFYLWLFIRSLLPGREITVNLSGLILPRGRRVTWDQITEVKLSNTDYIERLGMVRIGLKGRRRIRISWYHTSCEPRKLYEAIQACFEEHERRAELHG